LPKGDIRSNDSKFIAPSRMRMKKDMESLIHHFKLYTEGFSIPSDYVYTSIEAPKGEFGVFLRANQTNLPD